MKKALVGIMIVAMMLCSSVGYAAKESRYSLTNELDRVKMQHDGGFVTEERIEKDDPHYGWGLGTFYITGFTDVIKESDGTPVFLKNVGDELILGFDLTKNIDKLGKNKDCKINEDSNGHDKRFEVVQTNFGRGCLIVSETDYKNTTHKPVIYSDYLTAVKNKTANTKVKPFAEGDYVVALDYELQSPGFLGTPAYSDFSVSFKFKIRNSNCMVFFYNAGENKDEITNGAVAEEGFRIDYKNSYFLTVTVKKDIIVDNDGIKTLDTRFNRAASDGAEYKEEGLYTITVSNKYTNETTTKMISVGRNKILNVYAAHNGMIDPNEIAKKIDQGVEINDQWMLVLPEAKAEDAYNDMGTNYDGFRTVESTETNTNNRGFITPLNTSIFALAVIVLIILLKNKEKRKNEKAEQTNPSNDNDDDSEEENKP